MQLATELSSGKTVSIINCEFLPAVILLYICLFCSGSRQINAQVLSYEGTIKDPTAMTRVPVLDLSTSNNAKIASTFASDEMVRAKHYNRPNRKPLFDEKDPKRSDQLYSIGQYSYNGSYQYLPVSQSSLIVSGKVLSSIPHLSLDGSTVYSTFSLGPQDILKGHLSSSTAITLEREGGIVLYPSQKTRFEGIKGIGLPVPGFSYVFFLKPGSKQGDYIIITGYALVGDKVFSLDSANNVENTVSSSDLIKQIKSRLQTEN